MFKVAEVRKARGLSQTALARRLDIATQTVGAWETGRSMPQAALLPRIAAALDCAIDDLFDKEEVKS